MISCPICAYQISDELDSCPHCGVLVKGSMLKTLNPENEDANSVSPDDPTSDHNHDLEKKDRTDSFHERFIPGTIIAQRYRLISLLGRGGMGEVYRADDLTLNQPVALKFLPESLSKDSQRLELFIQEVRIARNVSHPNVCRVYDVVADNGTYFISMEYVDGEDLSSLLKRIGRIPVEKAYDITRQLCAALSAIHNQNILLRDLKPANIMIDGRGNVRIADFGLAGLPDSINNAEKLVGTPFYMAPEQLTGHAVSRQSDIYSLGLILYEIFTGQQAYKAKTIAELIQAKEESRPELPSSIRSSIDPAVEETILACLNRNPQRRPKSALDIAATILGQNPLEAVLAAGQTPSPELLASMNKEARISPIPGVAAFAGIMLLLVLAFMLSVQIKIPSYSPPQKNRTVLEDRAKQMLEEIGTKLPEGDSFSSFEYNVTALNWVMRVDETPHRYERFKNEMPPAYFFYYRQSPDRFKTRNGNINIDEPNPLLPNQATIILSPGGHLMKLMIVPPMLRDLSLGKKRDKDSTVNLQQFEMADSILLDLARLLENKEEQKRKILISGFMDTHHDLEEQWDWFFKQAGLDRDTFSSTESIINPPFYCDKNFAWESSNNDVSGETIRIEAGTYQNKPVFFQVMGPWNMPSVDKGNFERDGVHFSNIFLWTIIVIVTIGAGFLSHRNIKLARGDRKGAMRLALFVLGCVFLNHLFLVHHQFTLNELNILAFSLGESIFMATLIWILYMALEPYARRLWPEQLISWNRLMQGKFFDPLVSRDLLYGIFFGLFWAVLEMSEVYIQTLAGHAPYFQFFTALTVFNGPLQTISVFLGLTTRAIYDSMMLFVFLLILRIIFRKQTLAFVAFIVIFVLFYTMLSFNSGMPYHWFFGLLNVIIMLLIMIRFGLLALIFAYIVDLLFLLFPLTDEFEKWYAGPSQFTVVITVLMSIVAISFAFRGQRIFRDVIPDRQ